MSGPKHEDRLGPRDVALLTRGLDENGAGPCEICSEYTASRYGVHTGCVATMRRRKLNVALRKLEAIVRDRAVARRTL